jgi:folate-dependent phosphoribosylglycinamide formyltransferase PurN
VTPRLPWRVAVLTSWRADGLDALLASDGRWQLVAGVATEPASSALRWFDRHHVPCALRDLRGRCLRAGVPLSDAATREAFDRHTVAWLRQFGPDLVVLCGYQYRLSSAALAAWPHRILNIHDADLRLRTWDGRPRYPGLRAVRDAVLAGEPETRCTVHLVVPELDAGPPLVVSAAYPVRLPSATLTADASGGYIAVHRERMIRACWGPLLRMAVGLFVDQRVEVRPDGTVTIDGRPAPLVCSEPRPERERQEVA